MERLWILFVGLADEYARILLGYEPEFPGLAMRIVLGASVAGLVAGLIWAIWQRQKLMLLWLVPFVLTHALIALFQFFIAGALLYVIVEIAAVLLVLSHTYRTAVPSLLIGWFCLLYAALPILYFGASLAS